MTADLPGGVTGGSISTSGADTIHTFTTNGTFEIPASGPEGGVLMIMSMVASLKDEEVVV